MTESCTLVLVGRYPGKDRAVAQALAREFGRDDAWALQVVGASPIVMLENLGGEQANAIHAALAEVESAGCLFQIQNEVEEGTAKIQWPAAPRIRGRLMAEFPFATPAAGNGQTATLILPCPYTNQKMKLVISVAVQRADAGGSQLHIAAAAVPLAQPAQRRMPAPSARPPSRGTPIPSIPMGARAPIPVPMAQPRAPLPPQQVAEEPVIAGLESLESLEELVPMEQFPAPLSAPHEQKPAPRSPARGNPAPPRSPVAGVPLPDVPVLHNAASQPPRPTALPDVPQAMPMPAQVTAPMDLEVFEQQITSSGLYQPPAADELEEISAAEPAADNAPLCSVFMGKSNNPRVHQLYAELTGVSVQEAQRACQKAIVAIAKDISESGAHDLKARFAAINVQVRITRKK